VSYKQHHYVTRLLSILAWAMLGASGIAGIFGSRSPSLAAHSVLGPSLSALVAAACLFGLAAVLQKDTMAEAVWLGVLGGEFLAFGFLAVYDTWQRDPRGPLQGPIAIFGLGLLCVAVAARMRQLNRSLDRALAEIARQEARRAKQ
jgi:drug/metabolite transporter (DMT)-like permease